jgi:cellobionic acid phosphorylase
MKRKVLTHGFNEDGTRYFVRDIHWIDRADSDLWNDRMHLFIDHRGRCTSGFLQPNMTQYSEKLRAFYIRDDRTGKFWSAPYEPVQAEPDAFEFSAGLADIQWRVEKDGLRVDLRAAIPREDLCELWTATVTNVGRSKRSVSLYSFFPVGSIGLLSHWAKFDRQLNGLVHDYFPYYVHWQDYYKLNELRNKVICLCDAKPTSYETNLNDFLGGRGMHDPLQLHAKKLAGGECVHEPSAGIFQFARTLAPSKSATVNFLFGPAKNREEMLALRKKYLAKGAVDEAVRAACVFLGKNAPVVRIATPDAEFNHFINNWQSRRALQIGRTLRYNLSPQGRNVIQDAMGAVYVDPASARRWFTKVWTHQRSDGFLPHGMPMTGGVDIMPITKIPHRDTNVWGPVALHFYLVETGDTSILDQVVQFDDNPVGATLYEHINLGLEWLLKDRSDRGLSHIGEGDWNDPLNMAGKEGRGESVWLTESLAYSLDIWAGVAERVGDADLAARYRREAENCREVVNKYAWMGEWYARGTTDAGRFFGTKADDEGMIYINSQSWAILCGAATGKRLDTVIASMEKHLGTPVGPMTLFPSFSRMHEDIGKITQKAQGTGENASVYCHAVTFYAYALYLARRGEDAFRALRTLLPGYGGNTIERSGQLPLYVPNYFRGVGSGKKAGLSSHAPNTGTSSWYYRTAISMLMGIRAEFGGLRIDPQLPKAWKSAKAWRRFRGADFDIDIRRSAKARRTEIKLDGVTIHGDLIPVEAFGSRHTVEVTIPE